MNNTRMKFFRAVIFSWSSLLAVNIAAQEMEKRITMNQLPAVVRAAVKEHSRGAKIRGLAKETAGGENFYEVELIVEGHHKDIIFDAKGNVVTIEEQVTLESLPAEVKAEIQKQAGKSRIISIESVTEHGAIAYYEAHLRNRGKAREIKVKPNGKLIN